VRGLDCAGRWLNLERPAVMGVINVTPDSFSDGGVFLTPAAARQRAAALAAEGADIIDIGGESTRPGAAPVTLPEELDRVIPAVEAAVAETDIPVSIDTVKPEVMRAAVAAGAGMINDVNALRSPGALDAAAELEVPVVLMHMRGEPRTMQADPVYGDVVAEVAAFLEQRRRACHAAGIPDDRIVLDPGFGFGKTLDHNLALLRHLRRLADLGPPLLAGISRKSMLGAILDAPVGERLYGSLAAALIAVQNGAAMVRVHDVAPTRDALRVYTAVLGAD
jgi:dihydropteroate synthase